MSKPTPATLHRKELKRKKERKLMRILSPFLWDQRKTKIQFDVEDREERSRGEK